MNKKDKLGYCKSNSGVKIMTKIRGRPVQSYFDTQFDREGNLESRTASFVGVDICELMNNRIKD